MSLTSQAPRASDTQSTAKNQPREIASWAMYDWANSAYSTFSITILVSYLQGSVLTGSAGVLVWSYGIGGTMMISAVLSPILGAMADSRNTKREWLMATTLLGSVTASLMFFATPERPWLLITLFLIANLCYELCQGFYNAFLPEIVDDEQMGRVSAWGYGAGYLGGGIALAVMLAAFMLQGRFGIPEDSALIARCGLLMMGLWWALFSLPMFLFVRDRGPTLHERLPLWQAMGRATRDVGKTLRSLRRYRMLVVFLVGFLIFNDGVQTVITQASVFAQKVLEMKTAELVQVILMIQFLALPGALAVGWIAERIGQKTTLSICLGIWVVVLVAAYFVTTRGEFWAMAVAVAIVLGGTQSVSRTIMGLMTPEAHTAEFFGFFNLSGKATSMIGPVMFGTIYEATSSAHWAIVSLLVFILLGWAIIIPLDIRRGQQVARAANQTHIDPAE